jgi:hypothetical protein
LVLLPFQAHLMIATLRAPLKWLVQRPFHFFTQVMI